MSFQFIDNSAIDRRSRKLIRSHVMKGINKGRIISRPSKKQSIRQRVSPATPKSDSSPVSSGNAPLVEGSSDPSLWSIAFPIGHRFGSVRLPLEPGPYARMRLAQFLHVIDGSLYPPEFCQHHEHATSVWFQFMSTDEAFLHCTIALSASFIDLFLGKRPVITRSAIPPEALMHIAHAFRLTNEKLASGEAVANNTMASMLSLSLHEQFLTDYATGRIHLTGLSKIVDIRGGLLQLPRELAQKICRADIDVALHEGTSPMLHYPGVSGDQVYSLFGTRRKHSRLAEIPADPALSSIATDVSTIVHFLNTEAKNFKLKPIIYQDLILDLAYRLVEYRPSGPQQEDSLQTALRLALTSFMTTFILHFGHQRRIRFTDLAIRLQTALRSSWTTNPANRSFLLWALVVGGISEFGPLDYGWLLAAIQNTADGLGVTDWESLRSLLLQYPWVSVLHDDQAKRLWEAVKET